MNFNSWEFLVFLPIVVLLYWIVPHKFRWALLLIASYYFYMSWNATLIFLILTTTVVSYVAAILIERSKSKAVKKTWLIVTLIICLGMLAFFKYFNFLLGSVVGVLKLFALDIPDLALDIILPVGISFYTFQTLSYVVDVYWGQFKAERHFGYYALYVSYFPQLVAGPIERPGTLLPQLRKEQHFNLSDLYEGVKLILMGFFRKCVIADVCGIYVYSVYTSLETANSLAIFAASGLFLLQVYGDFAGYSQIALGAARLMGVKLTKNFDRPFSSTSVAEFMRRWHVTLNVWLMTYIYIPLGGSRKGMLRKTINSIIVFALCGLWHGADWTFVLWGLVGGILVSLESILKPPVRKLYQKIGFNDKDPAYLLLKRVCILIIFPVISVFFRAQNMGEAMLAFEGMFTRFGFGEAYFAEALSQLGFTVNTAISLLLAVIAMSLLPRWEEQDTLTVLKPLSASEGRRFVSAQFTTCLILFVVVAVFWLNLIAGSDTTSFVYFQF